MTRCCTLWLLSLIALLASANTGPAILLLGDSWAASIATQHHDPFPPGFGTFDALLQEKGYGHWHTRGAKTAWGGRKAQDWASPENLKILRDELAADPAIACVHVIIGGNDFLGLIQETPPEQLREKSPDQRCSRYWAPIVADIETILRTVLSQRPDVRVLVAGYDYLDPRAMERAYKFDFHGASTEEVNRWLQELGSASSELVRELAVQYPGRVAYLENWGTLQKVFGGENAGPAGGMPAEAQVGDGVHPNDAGHRALLENAFQAYYDTWLAGKAADQQPEATGQITAE